MVNIDCSAISSQWSREYDNLYFNLYIDWLLDWLILDSIFFRPHQHNVPCRFLFTHFHYIKPYNVTSKHQSTNDKYAWTRNTILPNSEWWEKREEMRWNMAGVEKIHQPRGEKKWMTTFFKNDRSLARQHVLDLVRGGLGAGSVLDSVNALLGLVRDGGARVLQVLQEKAIRKSPENKLEKISESNQIMSCRRQSIEVSMRSNQSINQSTEEFHS